MRYYILATPLPGASLKNITSTAPCRFLHRASLAPSDAESAAEANKSEVAKTYLTVAATAEQHLAVNLAGQTINHNLRINSRASRPASLKLKQFGSGHPGRGAQDGQLHGESEQHAQLRSSPAHPATWNLSEQLDFAEFLQRQQSHLEVCVH